MGEDVIRQITDRGPKPIGLNGRLIQHWFWKFVPVDPLIFASPNHDGSAIQIARQVYHRMVGRMVSEHAHAIQTGIIVAAWLLTFLIGQHHFRGGDTLGFLLGLAAFGACVVLAIPALMRMACPASAREEAEAIVRRTFLRNLPDNTPADLQDPVQQGWLTADGRPLSAEISAEDGRTLEATRRSTWWLVTAFAVGWAVAYLFASPDGGAPAPSSDDLPPGFPTGGLGGGLGPGSFVPGLGFLSAVGSIMVLLILAVKLIFDKRPLTLRAKELDVAAAVEGTAFVSAGGQSWGTIAEAARQRQIREAAGDPSPTVELGETTGVFAGRGDFFGASAKLPFRLSLRDLQMHMLVLGGTGSGKTSGVLRPLARQLSDYDNVGLVIMDGKGSLPGELARLPGMRVVEPGQPGTEVSLVSGVEPAVIVDTIREILAPSEGGEDQFWVNSAASVLRRGAIIAQAAGGPWWSLFHSVQLVVRKTERERVIESLKAKTENNPLLTEACAYFRSEWDTMDERTRSNILGFISSWLSTITATPELLRWAKTAAGTDTVDIMSPLTGGRIGFLIPEHRYGTAGAVVSALIKARLYNGLKSRADREWTGTSETPVVFIIDEAQEVATSHDAQMLAIGRSLGLAVVAATQGLEGVKAKLGDATSEKWLAIFGSVVALGGRSLVTDTFVSRRAGESWQLTPMDVEGATVRGSLSMEAMSGPAAAARTQPHMARIAGGGQWSGPSAVAATLASLPGFMLRSKTPRVDSISRLTLGSRPFVTPGEIASLTAVPDTAVILATRGRVPRRDVVQLRPEYVTHATAAAIEVPRSVAQAAPPPLVMTPAVASSQRHAPMPEVVVAGATTAMPTSSSSPAYEHVTAPATVAAAAAATLGKCPVCKTDLEEGAAFCSACGARLT
jgi:hypothetical protein